MRQAAVAILILGAACGGGTTTPASPPPGTLSGPQTATFTGSAQITNGGCSAQRHEFNAGAGTVTITLVAASAAAVNVQLCGPNAVNHATECTVPPFARL